MIVLTIGSQRIENYNGVSVSLQYDAVASTFGFRFYFDPNNTEHREIFRPATYKPVTLEYNGELLLTGTLLGFRASDSAEKDWVEVNGYSKTGVIEDCDIPQNAYPVQTNGLNLEQIAARLLKPFGLNVIVSPEVAKVCRQSGHNIECKNGQSVKEFLVKLAAPKHVMISHDPQGNLLLTKANTNQPPIHHFEKGMPGISMSVTFDGQKMHSGVTMIKGQTKGRKDGTHKKGNSGKGSYNNPFVPSSIVRPRVRRQNSSEIVDADLESRTMLSSELRSLEFRIEMSGWTLDGKLIRPNQIITVINPDLFLFQKTRLFISAVEFLGDESTETATLTCFLPSVFGEEAPTNIFNG